MAEELLTTREAARRLGMSISTFHRHLSLGYLQIDPVQKLDGLRGAYLFHAADIERLVAQRQEAS